MYPCQVSFCIICATFSHCDALEKVKSTMQWNLSSARAIASALDTGNNTGNRLLFTQLQDDDDSYSRVSPCITLADVF